MGSTRLPGKVLREVQGKSVLAYLLERLIHSKIGEAVLVTSSLSMDDPIEALASRMGVVCLRGDSLNVASRFKMVLDKYPYEYFVRICGDSPMLDQAVVQMALDRYQNGEFDLVTNTHPRSFPKGQSVEVVGREAYLQAYQRMSMPEDFEHVTRFFYRCNSEFIIENFTSGGNFEAQQLSIDTLRDFNDFEKIINSMDRPHWKYTYRELLALEKTGTNQNRNEA
jgi:spore coat polysaccharide biosynthesis protein SpsF